MKKVVKIILGSACGAFVGFALGVVAAMALGLWSTWAHPNDPSAGSVAIVVIATAPVGAIVGAALGGLTIASRPRLFLATFFPLAIFFLGLQVALSTLRQMDQPRSFDFEVDGTPGAKFVGLISVDGDQKKVTGSIPAKFNFKALQIDAAFALAPSNNRTTIAVKASADDRALETQAESQTGIVLQLKSFGYSEFFGGTSRHWHRMSPEEVDRLIEEDEMHLELRVP
jgi:MFS family permease